MGTVRRVALAAVLAGLLTPGNVMASAAFLDTMAAHLSLKTPPHCTVCHLTNKGGRYTVRTPFGQTAMIKYGLVMFDTERLKTVLDQMDAKGDDSDFDKVGDIEELRRGRDPNVNDETGEAPGDPLRFGLYCATVPGQLGSEHASMAWLLGIMFAARRISSRRRRALAPSAHEKDV